MMFISAMASGLVHAGGAGIPRRVLSSRERDAAQFIGSRAIRPS
jgi:hypothetical protein